MNRQDTGYAIEVMQAWLDGKTIQWTEWGGERWFTSTGGPIGWNHDLYRYRVKPEPREWWVADYGDQVVCHMWNSKEDCRRNCTGADRYVHVREVMEDES